MYILPTSDDQAKLLKKIAEKIFHKIIEYQKNNISLMPFDFTEFDYVETYSDERPGGIGWSVCYYTHYYPKLQFRIGIIPKSKMVVLEYYGALTIIDITDEELQKLEVINQSLVDAISFEKYINNLELELNEI